MKEMGNHFAALCRVVVVMVVVAIAVGGCAGRDPDVSSALDFVHRTSCSICAATGVDGIGGVLEYQGDEDEQTCP